MFVEKLVARPRHIEVQVLGDSAGNVVHLHERDCSVQLRNQKVIEIAPAPGLDPALRDRILAAAIRLAKAARYANAGTVEFLVSPERGEFFFIECNPRIQVEHTITEQVTGVDLVEAQFRIAAGASLESLGMADQRAVGQPRGFAVQSRIVAQGVGTLTAYKEPSGPGVRVDACGYLGYTPPPQFDPLLAKLIGQSNSSGTFESAVDRSLRALTEFHIGGLPTNVAQLRAILSDASFRAGDARTSLLAEMPTLMQPRDAAPDSGATLALLDQQAAALGGGNAKRTANEPAVPRLSVQDGHQGVESPMAGTVLEVSVAPGAVVSAGETLAIVTAMKMETAVMAPCAGTVTEMQSLKAGDTVAMGQVIAVIAPVQTNGAVAAARLSGDQTWAPLLAEVGALQRIAHARFAADSRDPGVVRQRNRGKLTCRERIALLLDDGTFREVGSLAGFASYDDEGAVADFTPANHVGGWGKIDGRASIVCADDFTSRGGHADGAIGAKSGYLDRLVHRIAHPLRAVVGRIVGWRQRRRDGAAAAEVGRERSEGKQRRDQGRPAAGHGWRRFVSARPPRQ